MTTRRHSLIFEGDVPEDEMKRAAFLAHPKIQEARAALEAAFTEAGHPHTAVSKTIKPRAVPVKLAAGRDRAAE